MGSQRVDMTEATQQALCPQWSAHVWSRPPLWAKPASRGCPGASNHTGKVSAAMELTLLPGRQADSKWINRSILRVTRKTKPSRDEVMEREEPLMEEVETFGQGAK